MSSGVMPFLIIPQQVFSECISEHKGMVYELHQFLYEGLRIIALY
jgi:hypothetical protein